MVAENLIEALFRPKIGKGAVCRHNVFEVTTETKQNRLETNERTRESSWPESASGNSALNISRAHDDWNHIVRIDARRLPVLLNLATMIR